jgi:hypothetical protein
MTSAPLKIIGKFLYFIGALILVPAGAVFIASPNTLMMAGPVALLLPIVGGLFGLAGKWMIRKAESRQTKS